MIGMYSTVSLWGNLRELIYKANDGGAALAPCCGLDSLKAKSAMLTNSSKLDSGSGNAPISSFPVTTKDHKNDKTDNHTP